MIIIKGNPARNVSFWAAHLLRDDTNELAEIKEMRGLISPMSNDPSALQSALDEMKAIARQSRCGHNFMYQANINPEKHERLTPAQWKEAVDVLEKNLGLEGHQRVVVEHIKEGRQHYHVIWNRVDVDTLKVADMGGNWRTHTRTSRELEERFDLNRWTSHVNSRDGNSAPQLWEIRAAERSGIDPAWLKAEITELWTSADSGKAFVAAVEERGYVIAKGDSRDFCIVDGAGDAHSLARRLDGVRAAAVRERMADVDREALPTVAQARKAQQAREGDDHGRPTVDAFERAKAAKMEGEKDIADTAETRLAARRAEREKQLVEATNRWEKKAEAERDRIDPVNPADAAVKPALVVFDMATGLSEGLLGFISKITGGNVRPPPEFTNAESMREIRAMRQAALAMENIRDSMEAGESLKAEDIRHLTPEHLENIKMRGDDFVRQMISDMERQRERDYGRKRDW